MRQLEYLGRYTHRVALCNYRLLAVKDGAVTFQWKDYRRAGRSKSRRMTLESGEFIRRLLSHPESGSLKRPKARGRGLGSESFAGCPSSNLADKKTRRCYFPH